MIKQTPDLIKDFKARQAVQRQIDQATIERDRSDRFFSRILAILFVAIISYGIYHAIRHSTERMQGIIARGI